MRPYVQRALFTLGAFAAAASVAFGQTALVHSEVARAETCLGPAEVRQVPASPPPEIVIGMFANTLREDELAQLKKDIAAFYQSTKNKIPFRLADLSLAEPQISGRFKTRALLEKALSALTPAASDTPPAQAFYMHLAGLAPQLGGEWSTVVLAARFPAPDADLTAYTAGWLSDRLRAAKLRIGYWSPSTDGSPALDAAAPATGGARLFEFAELKDFAAAQDGLREISWPASAPTESFRVCPVALLGPSGVAVVNIPTIAAASGFSVPDLNRYATLRSNIKKIESLLKAADLSAEQSIDSEIALNAALEVAPRDEEVLRLGDDLYRRSGNDPKLASTLEMLVEIAPKDAQYFAELGHVRFRMLDWDAADRALLRARELKPGDPQVAEELARIRITREDDRGAIPFLEERLAAGEPTQELWLLRADASARTGDWQRAADSLEKAIPLGGISLERRTRLVRIYMEHQLPDRALLHIRTVDEMLPRDATIRAEYARFLDDLHQPDEALAAWKRTLEVDPALELAHYRVTRLLIDKPDLPAALTAADSGIEAAPESARLYLAKSEIFEKQDRFYDARRTLREAVPLAPEPPLLARLSELEDAGGEGAAKYYRKLAESNKDQSVFQRGLNAALRDNDLENAAWFQSALGTKSSTSVSAKRTGTAVVPGGLAALAFAAQTRPASPERFFVEYARAAIPRLQATNKKAVEAYQEDVRQHFRRISELAALGSPQSGHVTIILSLQDKNRQKTTEKVLDLLGWKMRTSRQGVKLDPPDKASKANRQETASALAIDEIGMQTNLESGQTFSFDIPMEPAAVALGEEPWKTQFYAKANYPGGLAEAIANDLQLAETYAAIGQMDPETSAVLVANPGLKQLAEKYASQLWEHASALAVENGRAAVPGGVPAEPIWTKLTGANPAQPGPFFRALLNKDDGKLLAFYAALSELDIRHQRLFTRTLSRTAKFYELYKDSPEMQRTTSKHVVSGSFVEFLAEVPLNDDGSIDFPGSPEVWMVAKGQSRSTSNSAKLLKKVKRTVAPEVEDEILLRLADTHYKDKGEHSELDNFLAVVRIDDHRSTPLDDTSALLLAQHFAEDGAAYPYFAILTGLEQKHFEQFFTLTEAIRGLSNEERSAQLAVVNSLIEILCLAQQAGTLSEAQSAALFGGIVDRLQHATAPAARVAESLKLTREVLAQLKNAPSDPDAAIRSLLAESGPRQERFQQVLEEQKIPSLTTLFALYDAESGLASGRGSVQQQINALESGAAGLNFIEAPKELKLAGKEKAAIEGFQPRRLTEIVKEFRDKTAKKKVNPQDLEKLSRDYLAEMDAPVRWALEGIVYAYFLRPDDLVVSEDALLLRKHQFYEIQQNKNVIFERADLAQSSEKAGSYFTGGFANFSDAAGKAAAKSAKLGGPNGEAMAGKQISAIRSANWSQLRDEDLRLLGLKVAVAREWLVRAATQPDLQTSLAEESLGLLSLTRRAELLSALSNGDWRSVWDLVTLSDLYFLSDRYLARYSKDPWGSSATRALRLEVARNDGFRLQVLGPEFDDTFGCSHPHLRSAFPYEEYESDLFALRIAERSAEFKLYLARYADMTGVPASELGEMAEPAARTILKRLQLSDLHDWRSALAGYSTVDRKLVGEVRASR